MDIISRAEWDARAPKARSTVGWSQRTEFVVHYSAGPTGQSVRSIQDFHMDGRGWSDIGYNFLVDVDGRIYEGRGWLVIGAHAPDHNTSGIGVCMIGRDGDATAEAKRSIRWLYDEATRRRGNGLKELAHRDVYQTSCPGDELYAWVQAGMPADVDDTPDYVSVGIDAEQDLPPDTWMTVDWGGEYADAGHHHRDGGGPSFIAGPARYAFTANVRVDGLTPGTELQARAIEHADSGDDHAVGPTTECIASGSSTFVHHTVAADTLRDGHRVRFQVIHYGTETARITSGLAKAFAWPT